MKNLIRFLTLNFIIALFGIVSFGQSNTFPSSGNVGIGTLSPTHKLHVVAPSNTWKARFQGSDGYIDIGPANNDWAHIYTDRPRFIFNKDVYSITGGFSSYSSSPLYLKTNGSNRMTINTNGNVGIGTSSPSAKLEVYYGDIVIGGPHKKFIFHTQYWSNSSNALIIAPQNNGTWDFDKQVAFRDNGNLEVNGTIYSNEVKVQLSPFPDYVFSKNYSLMPLNQLEKFISKNGHLPNIPSSEEVEKDGIGIGELQIKQMEKIEELTLYILQLKKEIDNLKKNQSN